MTIAITRAQGAAASLVLATLALPITAATALAPLLDGPAFPAGTGPAPLDAPLSAATVGLLRSTPAATLASVQAAELDAYRRPIRWRVEVKQARWDAARRLSRLPIRAVLPLMRAAGDRIATLPYVLGGGHGSFDAAAYDCSGSVSYVLRAAGLLERPLTSGALAAYGDPGPGEHVTIYANSEHAFMTIDGRRFDTSALDGGGSRWSNAPASTAGYVVRHPVGL
ncbi:hypothetical protein DSM112329_02114 [Paraconexibacter sp. AEG42_29]|uniref:NlpC/P60 domain-containing protein n=1 Tax=Paraconexibacter sp. AEG42_29 TaxID=2997339 RepID=A0AAU7AUA9_9ACTN